MDEFAVYTYIVCLNVMVRDSTMLKNTFLNCYFFSDENNVDMLRSWEIYPDRKDV